MRGAALWLLGASAAFLVTASAFLLLANLGSAPETGDPIPQAEPPESPKPTLVLNLPEYRLEGLQGGPDQLLILDVQNGGDEEFPSVDIALDVASENTAWPHTRSYRETVGTLAPGETATVEFEIDLSPPIPVETRPGTGLQARQILEVRATTPNGASAVKTAVLAL